jgi:hypothetical protein
MLESRIGVGDGVFISRRDGENSIHLFAIRWDGPAPDQESFARPHGEEPGILQGA